MGPAWLPKPPSSPHRGASQGASALGAAFFQRKDRTESGFSFAGLTCPPLFAALSLRFQGVWRCSLQEGDGCGWDVSREGRGRWCNNPRADISVDLCAHSGSCVAVSAQGACWSPVGMAWAALAGKAGLFPLFVPPRAEVSSPSPRCPSPPSCCRFTLPEAASGI